MMQSETAWAEAVSGTEGVKYNNPIFTTIADAEAAVRRNSPDELADIVIAASLTAPDWEWVQKLCVRLSEHPQPGVRGNAILGLGHLARRFRRLDRETAEPLIVAGLLDRDSYVRGQSESAADDVEHFLGWRVNRGAV